MINTTADMFTEFFLFGVKGELDTNETQWGGFIDEISEFDYGEKAIEGVATASGGRLVKKTPQTDGTITLKIYPIGVQSNDTAGGEQEFAGTTDTSTDPFKIFDTNTMKKHRLVLLRSESLPDIPGTASAAVPAGFNAQRWTIINAYCTQAKPDESDKDHALEVTFKWPAFDRNGKANRCVESTQTAGFSGVTATPTSANGQW